MSLQSDVQRYNPGALVEFYVVDLSPVGGSVIRLHPGVNEFSNDVI